MGQEAESRRASSAVLTLIAVAVVTSIVFGPGDAAVAQDLPNTCPDGFDLIVSSGNSCVQIREQLPPNSHIGYTGNSVCDVGASIFDRPRLNRPVSGLSKRVPGYLRMRNTHDPAVGDDPKPDTGVRKNYSKSDRSVSGERTRLGLRVSARAFGDQAAPGDGETATTTEDLPSPPIGGDVQSVDTEGFHASYHCDLAWRQYEGEWDSIETDYHYSWVDGRMMVETSDSGGEAIPFELTDVQWDIISSMWSPGPWLALDGSSVLIAEGWSADTNRSSSTESIDTYSDLVFEPGSPTTRDEQGWKQNVVPYVGGYSLEFDEVDREGGGYRTTKERRSFSYKAWYHGGTGLVLATEAREELLQHETNYDETQDHPLGPYFEGGCILVDTNLNLSGPASGIPAAGVLPDAGAPGNDETSADENVVVGEGPVTDTDETGADGEDASGDEEVDPAAQAAAAGATVLLAGGWLIAESVAGRREDDAAGEEVEETSEETEARRQATQKRDIDEFMAKHEEYQRIYGTLFNPNGTINKGAVADMMDHYEKYGPKSEYAKQFAEEEKALRRFTNDFFDKHSGMWERQKDVERPDGTIDRALLRKLVLWQHKYGGPVHKESSLAWVADFLTGTMREVFTGIEDDGTISWYSMVLRGLVGTATLGVSEWIYTPGDSMYRLKDGVDRGETGLELYGKTAGYVLYDEAVGRVVGAGIGKGIGKVTKRFPGLTKRVGAVINRVTAKLRKPVFRVGKPSSLSPDLAVFKRQFAEAIDSGDDAALRQLYKNRGMEKMGQLEAGGHISPEQAKKVLGFYDDLVGSAKRSGTTDAINEFGEKYGVKPKEVLVGDSGSSGASRSAATDADCTNVTTFSDDALTNHARAADHFQASPDGVGTAVPDKAWAARDLQDKFTVLQKKNIEIRLNSADDVVVQHARNTGQSLTEAAQDLRLEGIDIDAGSGVRLDAADVDAASYSGFGSGAGPADSYPTGYTQARQSIQGRTEVFRVKPDGSVAKPYVTSGQAIVDQNALNGLVDNGVLPPDPTRISMSEMAPILEQQKISVAGHSEVKPVAKAVDRTYQTVVQRSRQPLPNQKLVDASVRMRANPRDTRRILDDLGMSEDEFVKGVKEMMASYNPELK